MLFPASHSSQAEYGKQGCTYESTTGHTNTLNLTRVLVCLCKARNYFLYTIPCDILDVRLTCFNMKMDLEVSANLSSVLTSTK